MGFITNNKAIVAFKNLLNKSNTDVDKEVGNEAEGIFFNVDSTTIFAETIDSIPSTAVTAGVAVFVDADLVVDATSNNHGYFAQWPSSPPSGNDPVTGSPFAYNIGSLLGIVVGDRVNNAIAPAYGYLYEAKPYDTGSNLIPPGHAKDWIYQYQSGIFFQQDESEGSNLLNVEIYVYIGEYLDDTIIRLDDPSNTVTMSDSDKNMTPSVTVNDGDEAIGTGITDVPYSNVRVFVNGLEVDVGSGLASYFTDSSTPYTVRALGEEEQGDIWYWNGSVAGYQLAVTDDIDFVYLTTVV